jgi:hypothetical protein
MRPVTVICTVILVAAPALGFAQDKPSPIAATPTRQIVAPETETLVLIQATPKAVCTLNQTTVKKRHPQYDADDRGIVRFYATARTGAQPITVHLECRGEDGSATNYPIDLRVGAPDALLKKPETVETPPVGKLLPPIQGDPMALSNKDLIARGYPPRPDPVAAPSRYALWLTIVSRPFTIVDPRSVPHPGVYHAPTTVEFPRLNSPALALPPPAMQHFFNNANSNTWSGAYITKPAGQYYLIEAVWHVPSVDYSLPDSPLHAVAAEWVGLDNNPNDLVQAGSWSESYNFGPWSFPNYYMWFESLPATEMSTPNFPISPGDEVFVMVFIADSSGETLFSDGNLTPADDKVWFIFGNWTYSTLYYSNALPRPSTFTGSTAEFIMERPCYGSSPSNCTPYPLAAFGFAIMSYGWYGDSAYADNINTEAWALPCNGTPPKEGSINYLNMENRADGDLLAVPFSLFPSSPSEPCNILWLWLNYQ